MTEPPDPSHRTLHDAPAGAVSLREAEEMEDDDGMMEVRMPVASTGEVRNENDTPLSPGELRGMAEQINAGRVGVFPEHGMSNAMDGGKYSAFEKLGYWADAEIVPGESADDEDLLMATARMPDPNTLPDVGAYRELLGVIKEQARRGVPLSASIGWRDDEDYPGGVDLMEASIVGIGADPRTQTETGTTALARAAVNAGADPDDLVAEVRKAVESMPEDSEQRMTEDDTPDEPDGGTTDDEQTAPDDGAETRAPEDVSEDDLLTFTAMHFEGLDEGDLAESVDAADGEYIGECDPEALADLVSEATGAEYGDVVDAMDALMSEGDGEGPDDEQGDYGDDEEDDEEDDERAAETDGGKGETPDEERNADTDTDDDTTTELTERVAELEAALEDVRNGEVSVTSPQKEQAAESDAEDGEERTADDETDSEPVSPTAGLGDYRSNR